MSFVKEATGCYVDDDGRGATVLVNATTATAGELKLAGLEATAAEVLVQQVAEAPCEALAAALAHEGWQAWYAEEGGDPVAFVARALRGGGLGIAVARSAVSVEG